MDIQKKRPSFTTTQKLRVLLSATVTDYAPAWTTSSLPQRSVTVDLSEVSLDRYSFLPHTEIPVFNVEDEPITDPAVCQYEAARNAGAVCAHFDELCRKAKAINGYKARAARRFRRRDEEAQGIHPNAQNPLPAMTPALDAASCSPQPPLERRPLETAIANAYDQLTGNRFQALADLEAANSLAEESLTSFAQMRDSPWRARPTKHRKRQLRKKYRFHQEVRPIIPDASLTPTVERNGLVLFTPPRTGKTQYLAAAKQTILQVSDQVTSDASALETLLDAGFIVATSNPAVLSYDVPLIAMFPGSVPESYTRKEGNMVCYTNVVDYELVFHTQILSYVKRYE